MTPVARKRPDFALADDTLASIPCAKREKTALGIPPFSPPVLSCLNYLDDEEKSRFLSVKNQHDIYEKNAAEMLLAINTNDWHAPVFRTLKAYDILFYLFANGYIEEKTFADVQICWLQPLSQFDPETPTPPFEEVEKIPCRSISRIPNNQATPFLAGDESSRLRPPCLYSATNGYINQLPERNTWFTHVEITTASDSAFIHCVNLERKQITGGSESDEMDENSVTKKSSLAFWCSFFENVIPEFTLCQTTESLLNILIPSYHLMTAINEEKSQSIHTQPVRLMPCYSSPDLDQYTQLHYQNIHPVAINHPEVKNNLFEPDGIKAGWFAGAMHDMTHIRKTSLIRLEDRKACVDLFSASKQISEVVKQPQKKEQLQSLASTVISLLINTEFVSIPGFEEDTPKTHEKINTAFKKWLKDFDLEEMTALVDIDFHYNGVTEQIGKSVFLLNGSFHSSPVEVINIIILLATLDENRHIKPYFLQCDTIDASGIRGIKGEVLYAMVKDQKQRLHINTSDWITGYEES